MSAVVCRVLPNIARPFAGSLRPSLPVFLKHLSAILPPKPMLVAWRANRGYGFRAGLWHVLVTSDVFVVFSLTVIDALIRVSSSLHLRRRLEPLHLQGMPSGSRAQSLSSIPSIHFLYILPSLHLSILEIFSQAPMGLS